MSRLSIRRVFATGVAAAIGLGGAAIGTGPAAAGEQILMACVAGSSKATLNPAIRSGQPQYYKSVGKSAAGSVCLVDPGISTNQVSQDPKYLLDNQTNGNTVLTVASSTTITVGSVTCNAVDPALDLTYPAIYPGQGKITTKYVELTATGAQIQLQAYIRLGIDTADPDANDFVASGIVIKGPGVGGSIHAVITVYPDLLSTKNLNIADCLANPAVGNAVIAVIDSTPADGSDADTDVDLWTVAIPND